MGVFGQVSWLETAITRDQVDVRKMKKSATTVGLFKVLAHFTVKERGLCCILPVLLAISRLTISLRLNVRNPQIQCAQEAHQFYE